MFFKLVESFYLGASEFRLTYTTHIADNRLMAAYEQGRAWAHRLTLHRYDPS